MAEALVPLPVNGQATPEALPFLELGTTGLKQYSGYVREEFLPQLSGLRGVRVYREMRENDATIGAVLFALEMLIRRIPWSVQPADQTPQAQEYAELVRGMLFEDMSQSWPMMLSEILSFLPYGWAYHEIVYKRRTGGQPLPGRELAADVAPSRYTDGLIGWRKWPIRAQETLLRWEFAPEGLRGMVQQDPVAARVVTVPIEKALLFRAFAYKGNPEGRSILRSAYRSWYMKTRIENIEGIGIERDLAGLPVGYIPAELFSGNLTAAQQLQMNAFKTIIRNIRRDEQEGVLWPLVYDDKGNKRYDLTLLSTGGSRQFDTSKVIDRYDTRILQSVLADVIMVGQGATGSYSLAETKSDLLTMAITGIVEAIVETVNRYAIPRLWTLNALEPALQPYLMHGQVRQVDFEKFTNGVKNLAQAGFVMTPDDEAHIRGEIGFPEQVVEEIDAL